LARMGCGVAEALSRTGVSAKKTQMRERQAIP
jgi:hypothetical protein